MNFSTMPSLRSPNSYFSSINQAAQPGVDTHLYMIKSRRSPALFGKKISGIFFIFLYFFGAAVDAQPRSDGAQIMAQSQTFNFKYFERLPYKNIVPAAQDSVRNLFPPGSEASKFEFYFTKSGAKCTRTSNEGEIQIICRHQRQWWLSTIVWVAVAYVNKSSNEIIRTDINRYSDGL